jgi:hypothetical protein
MYEIYSNGHLLFKAKDKFSLARATNRLLKEHGDIRIKETYSRPDQAITEHFIKGGELKQWGN